MNTPDVILVTISCYAIAVLILGVYLLNKKRLSFSIETFSYSGYAFFLGLIIYIVFSVCYYSVNNNYSERPFSKVEWDMDKEKRYELYTDLSQKYNLIGKGKEEIVNLLGQPFYQNNVLLTYYMGFKPELFAVNPCFLAINLDEEGKCINIQTRRKRYGLYFF